MNDDLDLRNRANQGNKAKDLLNNDIFNRVFEILEKRYIEGFSESKSDDSHVREICYRQLQALRKLREEISILVADGKLASEKLDTINKKKILLKGINYGQQQSARN